MGASDHDKNGMDQGAEAGDHESTHARSFSLEEDYGWLRSVVENSSENITVVDLDGTLRYASPAFGRMLGHDPWEAVGMNVLEHVHPDDLPHVLEETERALAEGGATSNRAEYRFRHRDGSWRWVESVGTYLLEDSAVGGVVVQTRDVTERKEAEEALRRSERERLSILESITDAFFSLDREWRFVYVNARAQALFSNSREDLLGEWIWEDPTFYPEYRRAVEEGRTVKFQALYPPSGLWYSVRAYPSDSGLSVYLQDITDRKRAEGRLRASEERYRTLVEQIPAVTYVHVQEPGGFSGTTYVSPQVEGILGYTPEEYTSDPEFWKSILHPEDRRRVLAHDERTGETGEEFRLEFRMIAKDGRTVWLGESGTLVDVGDDGRQVWHGVIFDITEPKRTEAALREAEERYRTLVEQIPAVTYVDRADGSFDGVYTSPQVEDLLGYTPEEWIEGKLWEKRLHPDDRERILAADEGLEVHGEPFAEEYRLLAKDGSVVWVREEAVLVRGEEGEPLFWQGVISDLTERRSTEEVLRRSEALLAESQRIAGLGTWEWDLETGGAWWSEETYRIHGLEPGEEADLRGKVEEALFPQDRPLYRRKVEGVLSGEAEGYDHEHRMRRADGGVRWVHSRAEVVRGEGGEPLKMVGTVHDVTERKEAEQALRESEERFRGTFEDAGIGMALSTPEGHYLRANRSFCELLGYSEGELLGMTFRDITHPGDLEKDLELGHRLLTGESRTFSLEKRYVRKDGSPIWVDLTVSMLRGPSDEPLYAVSQAQDISDRKALEERLRHQALHDPLTGLPNRTLLVERLGRALARSGRRRRDRVAVLFMDLDDFKVVNDSLGHGIGDELLVGVARRLGRCVRPEDTLARFGGDEFVLLLEGAGGHEEAGRVAERILDELKGPFVLSGRKVYARADIGIAVGDARAGTPEDLLRDADTAMYRAKEGGSGYSLFDPSMHERAVGRLERENDLRRAVEGGEFVVHYQPIVRLDGGGAWGVEALVRWRHPERGLLYPDEFVPLAEETGLVVPMGERILGEACRSARRWLDDRPGLPPVVVSVNLSARQLLRPDLAQAVEGILASSGLSPTSLGLDVTETVLVEATDGEAESVERLRDLGVTISLDDFGTGYSSLSYLKRLPADTLKVDRSFVGGIGENAADTAIVRTVIELAHTLGMEVVAEGVETERQATLLREMGCDLAQGYHFCGPLPPEEVPGFLAV